MSQADRKRRYRQRQRDGARVVGVVVTDRHLFALMDLHRLQPHETEQRSEIADAVATILDELADDVERKTGTRTHRLARSHD